MGFRLLPSWLENGEISLGYLAGPKLITKVHIKQIRKAGNHCRMMQYKKKKITGPLLTLKMATNQGMQVLLVIKKKKKKGREIDPPQTFCKGKQPWWHLDLNPFRTFKLQKWMVMNLGCFWLFRAAPAAYGGSQARGQIRTIATTTAIPDLHCICDQHHSSLQHQILNPPAIKPASSWIPVRFVSGEPQRELLCVSMM